MKKAFLSVLFTVVFISSMGSTAFAETRQAHSSVGTGFQSGTITINNHGMGY